MQLAFARISMIMPAVFSPAIAGTAMIFANILMFFVLRFSFIVKMLSGRDKFVDPPFT